MQISKYIYSFSYANPESELCKLESRIVFNEEEKNKQLSSDIKIEPSNSAFIKKRLELILFSNDYSALISDIKKENITVDNFKVEYLVLDGDTTQYEDRLKMLKDIGWSIDGEPDYYNPKITYALCYWEGIWCFGLLNKNSYAWKKHKQKPCSYSNSINIKIAKALVNIGTKGNKEQKLLDACCGVGTIMLEACFAGIDMEGCDINWKVCRDARINIAHFDYTATIIRSDIKDITNEYNTAIIDLPYNLLSTATDNDILHILESTTEITDRMVIVSTSDIGNLISRIGFSISDQCSVGKQGNRTFARKVWVCERKK